MNRLRWRMGPLNWLSGALLACCLVRLWLMPLPSSFWVDEMGTLFVVRQGPHHPSLAVAPQVPASIYYWLPRVADWLLRWVPKAAGVTEVIYRLPSVLCLGAALFFVGRIAARLIHPHALWFAIFACLALRGLDYEAANARPYALGMLAAAAGVWSLIRWLDAARWLDALLFVILAGLLWRVQLVYWPFYAVFIIYTLARLVRGETPANWLQATAIFALVALVLIPVFIGSLPLLAGARQHVIVAVPRTTDLLRSLKLGLIAISVIGAWLVRNWNGNEPRVPVAFTSGLLFVAWWMVQPLGLFVFSRLTGTSVFLDRYVSLALLGAALAATCAAAYFLGPGQWRIASVLFGVGVLVCMGQWQQLWPRRHNSDWRGAVQAINAIPFSNHLPVICPSPFIEARSPAWQPSYGLPGFLYAHLAAYPVRGRTFLLPFDGSGDAIGYAAKLTAETIVPSQQFVLYGQVGISNFWQDWFLRRPELRSWRSHTLGDFGDVRAVIFEGPKPAAH